MRHSISRHHTAVKGRHVHHRRCGSGAPVLLLHESPRSSVAMLPLLQTAPPGLCVLAPDTPGNGLSEALDLATPSADDYADALADWLDVQGIGRAVVYGTHTGAAFAMALAQRHPQRVAALVLDGVGAFDAAERAQLLDSYLPRFEPALDGSHLAWLWSRVRDQALFFPWNHRGEGARLWRTPAIPSAQALQAVALDMLLAGDAYRAPYAAAFRFLPAQVLPQLTQPTWLAAREDDMLRPHLQRLAPLPGTVSLHTLPAKGPAWAAQVWAWLGAAAAGLPDAPAVPAPATHPTAWTSQLLGAAGQQVHLHGRGCGQQAVDGTARTLGGEPALPTLWLPPSPGSARALAPWLQRSAGLRPVLVADLPGHGESDPAGSDPDHGLAVLHQALQAAVAPLGTRQPLPLRGLGLGAAMAAALAQRHPACYRAEPAPAAGPVCAASAGFAARDDGGHLLAAWWHARDEATLGPWWSRQPGQRFAMGDQLQLAELQALAVAALMEAPDASAMRQAWHQRQGQGSSG